MNTELDTWNTDWMGGQRAWPVIPCHSHRSPSGALRGSDALGGRRCSGALGGPPGGSRGRWQPLGLGWGPPCSGRGTSPCPCPTWVAPQQLGLQRGRGGGEEKSPTKPPRGREAAADICEGAGRGNKRLNGPFGKKGDKGGEVGGREAAPACQPPRLLNGQPAGMGRNWVTGRRLIVKTAGMTKTGHRPGEGRRTWGGQGWVLPTTGCSRRGANGTNLPKMDFIGLV